MSRLINPYPFPAQYWYKGQTHCHSDNSDGHQSPREVVEAYENKGYRFVCLTDHSNGGATYEGDAAFVRWTTNWPAPDPGVENVIYITSLEDGFDKPHHLLGLDLDLQAVNQYHDDIDPRRDENQNGADDVNTEDCSLIQQRIDYLVEVQKAVAILAHPDTRERAWYQVLTGAEPLCYHFADLQNNSRFTGIEIYSGGVFSLEWWYRAIQSGIYRRIWGTASDDCHTAKNSNFSNFNRGWIVINSPKNPADYLGPNSTPEKRRELKDHLIQNIKAGNFYSVIRSPYQNPPGGGPNDEGPHMQVLTVGSGGLWGIADTPAINVMTDQQSRIEFVGGAFGSAERKTLHYEEGKSASYAPEDWVDWVVIQILQHRPDGQEYEAYSQPIFQEKYHSFESLSKPGYFVRHRNYLGELAEANLHLRSLPGADRHSQIDTLRYLQKYDYRDGTFRLVPGGLVGGNPSEGLVSFEALNLPGWYLRHQNFRLHLSQKADDDLFKKDATFRLRPGLRYGNPSDPNWVSFESVNYPGYFIRESDSHLYLRRRADDPPISEFEAQATFRLSPALCEGIAFDAFS